MSHTIEVEVTGNDNDLPRDNNLAGPQTALDGFAKISGETLINAVSETVELIGKSFTPRDDGLESCVIKFGLKVSGSGNVILAKMGSELNLEVTVTWKR